MRSSGVMDFVNFCMSDKDRIKSDIVVECRSDDRRVWIKAYSRALIVHSSTSLVRFVCFSVWYCSALLCRGRFRSLLLRGPVNFEGKISE